MPTIPRNTITNPQKDRLPNIAVARPHSAEAMNSIVAQAGNAAGIIGRAAGAIGQGAALAGQQARLVGQRYESLMEANRYDAEAGIAMGNALTKIGMGAMQLSVDANRWADRRAREEASDADAALKQHLIKATLGYDGEGGRVAGTYETTYVPPSSNGDKGRSASIATANAIRAFEEEKDGVVSKLSPEAREYYNKMSESSKTQVMTSASSIDMKNITAYRDAARKAQRISSLQSLASAAATTDATESANWAISARVEAGKDAMRIWGEYQKDPSNMDFAHAQWTNEDVAESAKATRHAFVHDAISQRWTALGNMAQTAPTPADRDAILASMVEFANSSEKEGNITESDKTEFVLSANKIKDATDARFIREENNLAEEYKTAFMASFLTPEDSKTYQDIVEKSNSLRNALMEKNPDRAMLESEQMQKFATASEYAKFTDLVSKLQADNNGVGLKTSDVEILTYYISELKTEEARTKATNFLAERTNAANTEYQKQRNERAKDLLTWQVAYSYSYDKNTDTFIPMSQKDTAESIRLAMDAGLISFNESQDLLKKLRDADTPATRESFIQCLNSITRYFDPEELNEAVSYKDNILSVSKDLKAKIPGFNNGWFGGAEDVEGINKLVLEQNIIEQVVKQSMEFLSLPVERRMGKSLDVFIDEMMAKNSKASELNTIKILEGIENSRNLIEDMKRLSAKSNYPAPRE